MSPGGCSVESRHTAKYPGPQPTRLLDMDCFERQSGKQKLSANVFVVDAVPVVSKKLLTKNGTVFRKVR